MLLRGFQPGTSMCAGPFTPQEHLWEMQAFQMFACLGCGLSSEETHPSRCLFLPMGRGGFCLVFSCLQAFCAVLKRALAQ